MTIDEEPENTMVIDMNEEDYSEEDEQDFHIKTAADERLLDHLPERDDEEAFDADMYNFGDNDDMPDSDRLMNCQRKGISQKKCLDV